MEARNGKLVRRFQLALLVAAALIAIPSGASAATTIGQTFTPTLGCGPDVTYLHSTSPGGQYAAPSDGVITRWSFRAAASGADNLKFKVARSAADNIFTMIGESDPVDPAPSTLNSYFIRIPVKTGDIIGFYWLSNNTAACSRNDTDYKDHYRIGDVVPGTTAAFTREGGYQRDVSALLEPDCDKDGLGDETQDGNLSSCPKGTTPTPRTCEGRRVNIVGTPGNDVIVGTPGNDAIAALDGKDKVSGLGGNDVICGNDGRDRLLGQDGNDILKGNLGVDTLKGGRANDILKGNRGRDLLKGKRGNDFLGGGKGADTCRGGKGDDTLRSC